MNDAVTNKLGWMLDDALKMPEIRHAILLSADGSAGPGAYLAVSATENVDMEAVSFRLQELVQRLGRELSTPPRNGAGDAR